MAVLNAATPYFDPGLDKVLREMMEAGGHPQWMFLTREAWAEFWGPNHPAVVIANALDATPGARITARAAKLGDRISTTPDAPPMRKRLHALRKAAARENSNERRG